jgi:hypothetical protein
MISLMAVGCSSKLDRSKAQKALEKYLIENPWTWDYTNISFDNDLKSYGGVPRPKGNTFLMDQGFIERVTYANYWETSFHFKLTPKATEFVLEKGRANINRADIDVCCGVLKTLVITGITQDENSASVQYTATWSCTPFGIACLLNNDLTGNVYTEECKVGFGKYDDGWRIQGNVYRGL